MEETRVVFESNGSKLIVGVSLHIYFSVNECDEVDAGSGAFIHYFDATSKVHRLAFYLSNDEVAVYSIYNNAVDTFNVTDISNPAAVAQEVKLLTNEDWLLMEVQSD